MYGGGGVNENASMGQVGGACVPVLLIRCFALLSCSPSCLMLPGWGKQHEPTGMCVYYPCGAWAALGSL